MERVLSSCVSELDKDIVSIIIFLVFSEMIKMKDLVWDWQQVVSGVLVVVGRQFISKVMEELLCKLYFGILFYCVVLYIFVSFLVVNVFGVVFFLLFVLSFLLFVLGMVKQDMVCMVFCFVLQCFSEGVLEYLVNLDWVLDFMVRKDVFVIDIFSVYDVFFYQWLQS